MTNQSYNFKSPANKLPPSGIILTLMLLNLSLNIPRPLRAEAEFDPLQSTPALVLLSSPEHRTCATGFFIGPNVLATNHHAVARSCATGRCPELQLLAATQHGLRPSRLMAVSEITPRFVFPGLDLAILDIQTSDGRPLNSSSLRLASNPSPDPQAAKLLLGFPGCAELKSTRVKVVQQDLLHIYVEADADYGSSGSPMLDAQGTVVAVLDQAPSIISALRSRLGLGFGGARGIHAHYLNYALTRPAEEVATLLAERLGKYYDSNVSELRGIPRFFAGLQFMAMAERYRAVVRSSEGFPESARNPFLWFGDYPGAQIPALAPAEPLSAQTALVIAYNLETFGPRNSLGRPITPPQQSTLAQLGSFGELAASFISRALAQHYKGVESTALNYGLWVASALFVATTLLAFLAGARHGRQRLFGCLGIVCFALGLGMFWLVISRL